MIKRSIIICLVILMSSCWFNENDEPQYTQDSNERLEEPDYNVPRGITLGDITGDSITNLAVYEGLDVSGDYYTNVSFTLESPNPWWVIIDFNEWNPFRYKGEGINGGCGICLDLSYAIPADTWLDVMFIPPPDDEVFKEDVTLGILCVVDTDDCCLGTILEFTDEDLAILKQRFIDNDFFGFRVEFVVMPGQVAIDLGDVSEGNEVILTF